VLLLWVAGFGLAGAAGTRKTPAKPNSTSKKTVSNPPGAASSAKAATATKPVVARKASTRGKKKGTRRRRTPSWRLGQQTPTPERYREIQRALIDRGYLSGPATGEWGPESMDALRRFQSDQKLEASGKLDSLSLIALGLGPRRNPANPNGRAIPAETKGQP